MSFIKKMSLLIASLLFGIAAATTISQADDVLGTLIVLNKSEASASLLDLSSGKEMLKIPTGVGPHEVAVTSDSRIAVVANYGVREPGSSLTVIDLSDQKVVRTIDLEKYHRPHGIAFLPYDTHVVVTAEREKQLLIVDIQEGKVVANIGTSQDVSHMVALTPDASRAFVANIGSGSVSVINLTDKKLIKVIETGAGAEGIDVSPDGSQVWVTNRSADSISVIDAKSLAVMSTIPCGKFPIRLKFTPDGARVLVSNARSGDVAVFDAKTGKELHRIPMEIKATETKDRLFGTQFGQSPVPVGIQIAPDGKTAYVANTNADLITVIDLENWKISGRLTAGAEPDGLGYAQAK